MKYSIAIVIALIAACGSCAHSPDARPVTTDVPTVAQLTLIDEDGETHDICSVWKVADDLVVTAGHCCEDDATYKLSGATAVQGAPVKVLVDMFDGGVDEKGDNDVCVLQGKLNGPSVRIAYSDPAIGAHVWTVGYPAGIFLISEGIWAGRNGSNLGICSTVVRPGASGSPVLNAKGEAIGVLVRTRNGGDNITLVAPLEQLRAAVYKAMVMRDGTEG